MSWNAFCTYLREVGGEGEGEGVCAYVYSDKCCWTFQFVLHLISKQILYYDNWLSENIVTIMGFWIST